MKTKQLQHHHIISLILFYRSVEEEKQMMSIGASNWKMCLYAMEKRSYFVV